MFGQATLHSFLSVFPFVEVAGAQMWENEDLPKCSPTAERTARGPSKERLRHTQERRKVLNTVYYWDSNFIKHLYLHLRQTRENIHLKY